MSARQSRSRAPRRNHAAGLLAIAAVLGLVAPATSAASSSFVRASSDGSRVLLHTNEQLVSGDTDNSQDIYERSGGTTTLVSQGEINGNGNFHASFAGASSDGSRVFFHTNEQLVSGDTDDSQDIYERSGGTTTLVSQGEINGNGAFDASLAAGPSSDGSKVFFQTQESLVNGDTDSSVDVYERSGGTTTWVSQGEINGNGAFDAFISNASSDGSRVFLFTEEALVSSDTDGEYDAYERSGGTTTWVSQGEINGNGAFDAFISDASSDGSKVFFQTQESLVSGDTDSSVDVYERSGGTTTWVSQGEINGNGASDVGLVGASSDGSRVFIQTDEQLVSGDTDNSQDVYERSGGTTTWVSQGEINGDGSYSSRSSVPRATARGSFSAPPSSWSAETPTAP